MLAPSIISGVCVFPLKRPRVETRDAGAIVGKGGRGLEKGTCTDYDVIMTS